MGSPELQACINPALVSTTVNTLSATYGYASAELCITILKAERKDLYGSLDPEAIMASIEELRCERSWYPLLALGKSVLSSDVECLYGSVPIGIFSEAVQDLLQFAGTDVVEEMVPSAEKIKSSNHLADIQAALQLIASSKQSQKLGDAHTL